MRKYKLLLVSSYVKCTKKNKISFITLVNNEDTYSKTLKNWKTLKIPNGMTVEYIAIRGAKSMTEGCNAGMLQSDAKYKIYIHQDVYFENNNFLKILLDSFRCNKEYGIAGVVGCREIPVDGIWWESETKIGGFRDTHLNNGNSTRYFYQTSIKNPVTVSGLDGFILATQYDIPWRSDIFDKWHFYDMSQCMEFKRYGYKAIVLPQLDILCFHNCGPSSLEGYDEERIKFLNEYLVELADE